MPKRTAPPGRAFSDIRCENHGVALPLFSGKKRKCSSFRLKAGVLPIPIGDNKKNFNAPLARLWPFQAVEAS